MAFIGTVLKDLKCNGDGYDQNNRTLIAKEYKIQKTKQDAGNNPRVNGLL